jgi:membrane protease YdiL (CAAX protease family)
MVTSGKPPRPFGLSLAILVCVLLFTVVPLVVTMILFYINGYFERTGDGAMSGLLITNFSTAPLVVVMFGAILFAFVAIFAWRGRPKSMRYIFPLSVGIAPLLLFVVSILPALTSAPSLQQGIDSSLELSRQLLSGYSGTLFIAATYSIWFCNRWSARAFFRGYYSKSDLEKMRELAIPVPLQSVPE